ncbi:hypothetical protein SAY86_013169 [Trapa natans]|uniref:HXXXD-type acyl-transferase family protein n=1 Tax=Trapa natans TaxID=22666 RepID=A0AAN7ME27_TRANT|nr:hypothetical protein SAY86_013169 [Trapa natans]
MDSPSVQLVSDQYVQPRQLPEESKKPIYLPPWDLAMLSVQYIQKGLLFVKPHEAYTREGFMESFLDKLKVSLSIALVHFYPLAGRLKTIKNDDPHLYTIYIDCMDSPGAKLIHATLDMTVSDILSPVYVPTEIVQSFFDHHRAVNHDGHTKSLLTIQVTELVDGVFIGCSFNHVVGDGTSYWNFFNALSEIFQARERGIFNDAISRPPILERWFPDGCRVPLGFPYNDPSDFIVPFGSPVLKERMFHFSAESISRLKSRVNEECGTKGKGGEEISSFKSLTALVWRSIIRARRPPDGQVTHCRMATNNRQRMHPPGLPQDYFGNCISFVTASTTTGELLGGRLGAAARLLHVALAEHTAEKIDEWLGEWLRNPSVYHLRWSFDPYSVMMGSSPRFNKYGNEFGLGKALALRSGYAHKFDGKVSAYPGREGGGSVDLEICLLPGIMAELEADQEFMAAVEA